MYAMPLQFPLALCDVKSPKQGLTEHRKCEMVKAQIIFQSCLAKASGFRHGGNTVAILHKVV